MFEFTELERISKSEMRALAVDSAGREVLVGLTFDETVEYMTFNRAFRSTRVRDPARRARYRVLHDKHQAARLEVLGAEGGMREDP